MVHIEIRNGPDEVKRVLQDRAAKEGKSLSGYLRDYLADWVEQPSRREMEERIRSFSERREER
jgi:plasmid stability protein